MGGIDLSIAYSFVSADLFSIEASSNATQFYLTKPLYLCIKAMAVVVVVFSSAIMVVSAKGSWIHCTNGGAFTLLHFSLWQHYIVVIHFGEHIQWLRSMRILIFIFLFSLASGKALMDVNPMAQALGPSNFSVAQFECSQT